MKKWQRLRLYSLIGFLFLSVGSAYYASQLQFAFSLDQFFPEGDPELAFFKSFTEEFENDIDFLLVAFKREEGVFEQSFLDKVHAFTLGARDLTHVRQSQSLTRLNYPLKTPFGITTTPVIHRDQPERYESDKERILADSRFVGQFINEDATALVVALRTNTEAQIEESQVLIADVDSLIASIGFTDYYKLGPAYFQKEMVRMQKREVAVSALVSGILVAFIMFLLFRRPWGIAISLTSIALGMLLFLGILGLWGRPLNAMAALYPVLMIIVGTSDVVHIMTKYIAELRKGNSKREAVVVTIKEIGLATLLTSLTTAVGFASLSTSKVAPIRDFGLNAALGVLVAYFTVIFFTTAALSFFGEDQLTRPGKGKRFWEHWMLRSYAFTTNYPRQIIIGLFVVLGLSFWGISKITTNYRIESNLPRGSKVTEDFQFYEREMAGFRPMEIAVFAGDGYNAYDYELLQQMDSVERYLASVGMVRNIQSVTTLYKSIEQMNHQNRPAFYKFPEDERSFKRAQRLISKLPDAEMGLLISQDSSKARISSRLIDVGADSIKAVGRQIDDWIASNTNAKVATYRRTGTGLILDRNSEYVRDSLLKGLGLAVLIVSLLMALLFRNIRIMLISLLPNLIPLLMAGAMLGFMGVELEAGISIIFAVVFGIAVDDTIHFLSKYRLARAKGLSMEEALKITFLETGKAICLTTIILFFGFLVMLFSIHPPSVTIGALISLTLVSALVSDLLIIPVLIRKWGKGSEQVKQ